MFVDVGAEEEFPEGTVRVMSLAGRSVGVVRWRGEVFALRNVCPHQYGPVCEGHAMPMIVADEARTLEVDDERLVIVCPWHGWEFDARTGRAIWAAATHRVATYAARLDTGRVLVDADRRQRAAPRTISANH